MRSDSREKNQLRPLVFETNFVKNPLSSTLVSLGQTKILCTVHVEDKVPGHRLESGGGWLTAEYAMLPGSTPDRKRREIGKRDGRSVEIQRLIGRSLRAVVNLDRLGQRSLWVDCDVLQADGSTRCTSICGASVALMLALRRLTDMGVIPKEPAIMAEPIAAVSVGIVDDEILVDLCYTEDSRADVDMNVVATASGKLIEIQGTAEGAPFPRERAAELIDAALGSIEEICAKQLRAVEISA